MKRIVYPALLDWKADKTRKPLILRGARQVGKTHVVRQLGQTFTHFIEINFERTPQAVGIFLGDLDPKRLSRDIEILTRQTILPGKTLLFLDEVQVEPRIITALRYYYEEMSELHVIAAGSLLDFAIESVGVPVGRVSFMTMYPLSFIEYLKAAGHARLATAIIEQTISAPMSEVLHHKALALVAEYLAIGGMPEVVSTWITTQNLQKTDAIKQAIISAYRQDFDKYATKTQIKYLDYLYEQLPRLMGSRFKYSQISTAFRKRELAPCLELLRKARVLHQTHHSDGQGIPLGGGSDLEKFKVIPLDIGLSQNMLGLNLTDWFLNADLALINKGEITECFVGQELLAYQAKTIDEKLYYWQREERGSSAEIDYLITQNANIIPIEVKSGPGSSLKSLRLFLESHPNSPHGIRFSIHNYSIFDGIHSYPLYAVAGVVGSPEQLLRLIEL